MRQVEEDDKLEDQAIMNVLGTRQRSKFVEVRPD
jgi:hypothetical protein